MRVVLLIGGIIGCFYPIKWPAIVHIVCGVIVLMLELPMPGIFHLGYIVKNYAIRAVLYMSMFIPAFFGAAGTTGGMCVFVNGIVYAIAAQQKEEWTDPRHFKKPASRNPSPAASPNHRSEIVKVVSVERDPKMSLRKSIACQPRTVSRKPSPTHSPRQQALPQQPRATLTRQSKALPRAPDGKTSNRSSVYKGRNSTHMSAARADFSYVPQV